MTDRKKLDASSLKAEKVVAHYLFQSDFYQIKSWAFDFEQEDQSSKGYNDCLCLVFVRNGNFRFNLSKEQYDLHTGHAIIDKPDYEYSLRPAKGQCSIFNFSREFYDASIEDLNLKYAFFFGNKQLLSLLIKTSPEIEYLHHLILTKAIAGSKLEIDHLVLELFQSVAAFITDSNAEALPPSLRRHHISTMEKAKEYINENFASDISLYEIARFACISPFHFSRVFKQFTSYSPHQYLLNIRLKHAEILLKNHNMSITDIAIASGFASAEYFATAFGRKYQMTPSQYRNTQVK
jgi:AraC-like DNA-binding protein